MSGTLYLVSTPIGNLEDLSFRAARVLGEVDLIACEDTRVTRKLLNHYEIKKPTISLHEHSNDARYDEVVARIEAGESVAYATDAGTPGVSDPGSELVRRAHERGISVVPIPGPSALSAVMSISGLDTRSVLFLGFLPRGKARRAALAPWVTGRPSLVIYESPKRTPSLLTLLVELFGEQRPACVARELTKLNETVLRGSLGELAEALSEPPKGEVVVMVEGRADAEDAEEEPAADAVRDEALRLLAAGTSPSETAKMLAGAFGMNRKEAYRLVLSAKADDESLP